MAKTKKSETQGNKIYTKGSTDKIGNEERLAGRNSNRGNKRLESLKPKTIKSRSTEVTPSYFTRPKRKKSNSKGTSDQVFSTNLADAISKLDIHGNKNLVVRIQDICKSDSEEGSGYSTPVLSGKRKTSRLGSEASSVEDDKGLSTPSSTASSCKSNIGTKKTLSRNCKERSQEDPVFKNKNKKPLLLPKTLTPPKQETPVKSKQQEKSEGKGEIENQERKDSDCKSEEKEENLPCSSGNKSKYYSPDNLEESYKDRTNDPNYLSELRKYLLGDYPSSSISANSPITTASPAKEQSQDVNSSKKHCKKKLLNSFGSQDKMVHDSKCQEKTSTCMAPITRESLDNANVENTNRELNGLDEDLILNKDEDVPPEDSHFPPKDSQCNSNKKQSNRERHNQTTLEELGEMDEGKKKNLGEIQEGRSLSRHSSLRGSSRGSTPSKIDHLEDSPKNNRMGECQTPELYALLMKSATEEKKIIEERCKLPAGKTLISSFSMSDVSCVNVNSSPASCNSVNTTPRKQDLKEEPQPLKDLSNEKSTTPVLGKNQNEINQNNTLELEEISSELYTNSSVKADEGRENTCTLSSKASVQDTAKVVSGGDKVNPKVTCTEPTYSPGSTAKYKRFKEVTKMIPKINRVKPIKDTEVKTKPEKKDDRSDEEKLIDDINCLEKELLKQESKKEDLEEDLKRKEEMEKKREENRAALNQLIFHVQSSLENTMEMLGLSPFESIYFSEGEDGNEETEKTACGSNDSDPNNLDSVEDLGLEKLSIDIPALEKGGDSDCKEQNKTMDFSSSDAPNLENHNLDKETNDCNTEKQQDTDHLTGQLQENKLVKDMDKKPVDHNDDGSDCSETDSSARRNIFDVLINDYKSPSNSGTGEELKKVFSEAKEKDNLSATSSLPKSILPINAEEDEETNVDYSLKNSILELIQHKLKDKVKNESVKMEEDTCTRNIAGGKTPTSHSILDLINDHGGNNQVILIDSDEEESPPKKMAPKWRTLSGIRQIVEPVPLHILKHLETAGNDKSNVFSSPTLDSYIQKAKPKDEIKMEPGDFGGVDSGCDGTRKKEDYCDPDFDEVDGVLFMSFSNEDTLNAHIQIEKKTNIAKNEHLLLGMARMKAFKQKQKFLTGQRKRVSWLKMQNNISLKEMKKALSKYQKLFISELSDIQNSKQHSKEVLKSPQKTSDITKIKGWKKKYLSSNQGQLEEARTLGQTGKLHWRTEARLVKNLKPEELKEIGLNLKKKRRKNLIFTIRKGMSKGDNSRAEKLQEIPARKSFDSNDMIDNNAVVMENEIEDGYQATNEDGSSLSQQESGVIKVDDYINIPLIPEKRTHQQEKQDRQRCRALMQSLHYRTEDENLLRKLGGQRLLKNTKQYMENLWRESNQEDEIALRKRLKKKKDDIQITVMTGTMARAALTALDPKYCIREEKGSMGKPGGAKGNMLKQQLLRTDCTTSREGQKCSEPGCRYGCICHLCKVEDGFEKPDIQNQMNAASSVETETGAKCNKEYCRLGCICDSVGGKHLIEHCGKEECMLHCVCENKGHKSAFDDAPDLTDTRDLKEGKNDPKKATALPRRKSTYRLAKNLDAVSRKAMLYYESSEMFTESTTKRAKKSKESEPSPVHKPEMKHPYLQGPRLFHEPHGSIVSPRDPKQHSAEPRYQPGAYSRKSMDYLKDAEGTSFIQLQQRLPSQTYFRKITSDGQKTQQFDYEDATFEDMLESEGEETIEDHLSSARTSLFKYVRRAKSLCTCAHHKDGNSSKPCHSHQEEVRGQGSGSVRTTDKLSKTNSAIDNSQNKVGQKKEQSVDKNKVSKNWTTQWVCLKTSKKKADEGIESYEFKLLEMISNCDIEKSKTKILSKISSAINKEGYPIPRVVKIDDFNVEFLPKAKKPAIIPSDVQSKLPPSIFSIRVKVYKQSEVVLHMDKVIEDNEKILCDSPPAKNTSESSENVKTVKPIVVSAPVTVYRKLAPTATAVSVTSINSSSSSYFPVAGGISALSKLQLKIVTTTSSASSVTQTSAASGNICSVMLKNTSSSIADSSVSLSNTAQPSVSGINTSQKSIMLLKTSTSPRLVYQAAGVKGPVFVRPPLGSKIVPVSNVRNTLVTGGQRMALVSTSNMVVKPSSASVANLATIPLTPQDIAGLNAAVSLQPTTMSFTPTSASQSGDSKLKFVSLLKPSGTKPVIQSFPIPNSNSILCGPFDSLKDVSGLKNMKVLQASTVSDSGGKQVQLIPVTTAPQLPASLQHLVAPSISVPSTSAAKSDLIAVPFRFEKSAKTCDKDSAKSNDKNVLMMSKTDIPAKNANIVSEQAKSGEECIAESKDQQASKLPEVTETETSKSVINTLTEEEEAQEIDKLFSVLDQFGNVPARDHNLKRKVEDENEVNSSSTVSEVPPLKKSKSEELFPDGSKEGMPFDLCSILSSQIEKSYQEEGGAQANENGQNPSPTENNQSCAAICISSETATSQSEISSNLSCEANTNLVKDSNISTEVSGRNDTDKSVLDTDILGSTSDQDKDISNPHEMLKEINNAAEAVLSIVEVSKSPPLKSSSNIPASTTNGKGLLKPSVEAADSSSKTPELPPCVEDMEVSVEPSVSLNTGAAPSSSQPQTSSQHRKTPEADSGPYYPDKPTISAIADDILETDLECDVDVEDVADGDDPVDVRRKLLMESKTRPMPCMIHSGSRKRKLFMETIDNQQVDSVEFSEGVVRSNPNQGKNSDASRKQERVKTRKSREQIRRQELRGGFLSLINVIFGDEVPRKQSGVDPLLGIQKIKILDVANALVRKIVSRQSVLNQHQKKVLQKNQWLQKQLKVSKEDMLKRGMEIEKIEEICVKVKKACEYIFEKKKMEKSINPVSAKKQRSSATVTKSSNAQLSFVVENRFPTGAPVPVQMVSNQQMRILASGNGLSNPKPQIYLDIAEPDEDIPKATVSGEATHVPSVPETPVNIKQEPIDNDEASNQQPHVESMWSDPMSEVMLGHDPSVKEEVDKEDEEKEEVDKYFANGQVTQSPVMSDVDESDHFVFENQEMDDS